MGEASCQRGSPTIEAFSGRKGAVKDSVFLSFSAIFEGVRASPLLMPLSARGGGVKAY